MRIERTASLLARARVWLRDEHVLAPADSVLRRMVGAARHKARALLTERMAERLSPPMRDRLDALVAVGDDHPHSPLHGIKTGTSSPSVGGMKRLLARLESIEETGALDIDVSWVNGNYQRILFHSVRTASADRMREMVAPRRHLALVCVLVEDRLDDMLKAQRHAVDRIVQRYRRLGAVLLDPDVGDDGLRARLLSIVPEEHLREDQSDLANWTRGDRKARFEQTAERHAGLSQFAAPFLSRMRFVDEHGEGASPTLSALRAYREHRAAGRRGLPPDVSLDFAPPALQPLIHRNGVTDRPAGRVRCSSRCATNSRPATSPSRARRTSAASRPSSCRPRSGSRSAMRSGRAPDSPSTPERRSSACRSGSRTRSTASWKVLPTIGRSRSTTTGGG